MKVSMIFNFTHGFDSVHQLNQIIYRFNSWTNLCIAGKRWRQQSLVDLRLKAHDFYLIGACFNQTWGNAFDWSVFFSYRILYQVKPIAAMNLALHGTHVLPSKSHLSKCECYTMIGLVLYGWISAEADRNDEKISILYEGRYTPKYIQNQ